MEYDTKRLEAFLEHKDARQSGFAACETPSTPANGRAPAPNPIKTDEWLREWGPPLDVLEFTREQIFDEMLRLRDDERQRIGQELHDSAGQLLLSLQLSVARLKEAEENSGHLSLLGEIQDTARLITQEIRCLAFLNHPASMNAGGLASALDALMSGFGKRTGFRVTCRVSGEPAPHDGAASFTLLRIAQEALVNVHRHAHATAVDVRLKRLGNFLGLSIADNGVGMPSSNELACRGGVGVQGMRFRVEKLGGRFAITNLEHGTRITAIVPMAE